MRIAVAKTRHADHVVVAFEDGNFACGRIKAFRLKECHLAADQTPSLLEEDKTPISAIPPIRNVEVRLCNVCQCG